MSEESQKPNTESSLEQIQKQLEELQKQKGEYLAGWQRARADFLNYKKEELERIKALIDYASEEMLLKILPLMDNLETAEKNLPPGLKENEHIKGWRQIKTQFENFLENQGVKQIEALGKKFDPRLHEVVSETEDKNQEPGTIIQEIQKGYSINGQLLRPAKVVVVKN